MRPNPRDPTIREDSYPFAERKGGTPSNARTEGAAQNEPRDGVTGTARPGETSPKNGSGPGRSQTSGTDMASSFRTAGNGIGAPPAGTGSGANGMPRGTMTPDAIRGGESGRPAGKNGGFSFTPLAPGRIPGIADLPRMDYVPDGLVSSPPPVPSKRDLEPLRKVTLSPVDFLRTPEERSRYLARHRFTLGLLPYTNTNIFILQIAAIISLYAAISLNFFINPPESGILGEVEGLSDFMLWGSPLSASLFAIIFGTVAGGIGVYLKGLKTSLKDRLSMILMQTIAGVIVFITIFFIFIPLSQRESLGIGWFEIPIDIGNLDIFMEFVIIPSLYLLFLILFSAAVILGVYGLLTGSTGSVSLSTALIFLQVVISLNTFEIPSDDLYSLFRTESRILLFSMAYLSYVELSYAVSKFSYDWKRTSRYDHRTGEQTFTFLLGSTINIYIVFFFGIIVATFLLAMFSSNLDWIVGTLSTPAMKDSIEHSTIYGKTLFALIFFGILGFLKGIVPMKEYIEGRMNVTDEEMVDPMTILEQKGEERSLYEEFDQE